MNCSGGCGLTKTPNYLDRSRTRPEQHYPYVKMKHSTIM